MTSTPIPSDSAARSRRSALLALCCLCLSLVWSQCASRQAYRPYKEGLARLEAGAADAALPHLEAARRRDPDSMAVRQALNRAKRMAVESRLAAAIDHLDREEWTESLELVNAVLRINPLDPLGRDLRHRIEGRLRATRLRQEAQSAEYTAEPGRHEALLDDVRQVEPYAPGLTDVSGAGTGRRPAPHIDPISLNFVDADIRDVIYTMAEISGLNLIVDDNVDDRMITVMIVDHPFDDALDHVLTMAGLFKIALDEKSYLIANDTAEDRDRFERDSVRSFHLRHADAESLGPLLEPLLPDANVTVNAPLNMLMVRGRPDDLALAGQLIRANDVQTAEVLLEIDILEVNRNRLRELGLEFDDYRISGRISGPVKADASPGGLTLRDLRSIGDGGILVSIPAATLRMLEQDTQSRTLATPKLRILNRKKARLHIGEKVPVKTSTSLFRDAQEELNTFEYKDIGIVVEITPHIISDDELSIELKLEISSVLRESSEGQPTIGTRELESTLHLRDGEAELIAGLIRDEERQARLSIPLVGNIPLVGRLFGRDARDGMQSDIIMSLKPHILGSPTYPPQAAYDLWTASSATSKLDNRTASTADAGRRPIDASSDGPLAGAGDSRDETDENERSAPDPDEGRTGSSNEPGDGIPAQVLIYPERIVLGVGEKVELEVRIQQAQNVAAAPFYLLFDPEVIQVIAATEGSFFNADGSPTSFMTSIDNETGQLIVGLSRLGGDAGADGEGDLVNLTIQGMAPGESALTFSRASLRGPDAARLAARFRGAAALVK